MRRARDGLDLDGETASNLKRLVLEELGDEIMLDDGAVDALVRGIVSLLRSNRRGGFADKSAPTAE
jgi:hypothetical protein